MTTASMNSRTFQTVLKRNGYYCARQNGDHQIWKNDTRTLTFSCVKSKPVIMQRLIKEYGLTV